MSKFDAIKDNPTLKVGGEIVTNALALAAARQSTRAAVVFLKGAIAKALEKSNRQDLLPMLDSEHATKLLELFAPIVLHGLATNGMMGKYGDQVAKAAAYGIQANTSVFMLHYTDIVSDMLIKASKDPELKVKVLNLAKMGAAIQKADNGEVNPLTEVLTGLDTSVNDELNNLDLRSLFDDIKKQRLAEENS